MLIKVNQIFTSRDSAGIDVPSYAVKTAVSLYSEICKAGEIGEFRLEAVELMKVEFIGWPHMPIMELTFRLKRKVYPFLIEYTYVLKEPPSADALKVTAGRIVRQLKIAINT